MSEGYEGRWKDSRFGVDTLDIGDGTLVYRGRNSGVDDLVVCLRDDNPWLHVVVRSGDTEASETHDGLEKECSR